MSPRTVEQYEQIRSEKRTIIMNAAIEVFAEKSFQGASVSMIAQKAGISKGLLYNYFKSKEELLKEIIKNAADTIYQYFDPNHDGILTAEEFFFFIRKNFQVVKENVNYWKLYSALVLQPSVLKLIDHDFDEVSANYIKLVYDLFERSGIEDVEGELLLLTSMVKGAIIQYVAMPDFFPIDKIESKILEYYRNKLSV
ncbi:MAG: TetR/AcrR family transcriptional regulator [Bacteroidales bacterium]|nr:TetR/AcrR family transcriptional regulator [Bacteroidales bacterium]